jgi:hypothetical protein
MTGKAPSLFAVGDAVAVTGGKYQGSCGHILKITDQMSTIRLLHSDNVIRVMSRNVQARCESSSSVWKGMPKEGLCHNPCCRTRLEALAAAKEDMIIMRKQIDDVIAMLERLTTTK